MNVKIGLMLCAGMSVGALAGCSPDRNSMSEPTDKHIAPEDVSHSSQPAGGSNAPDSALGHVGGDKDSQTGSGLGRGH